MPIQLFVPTFRIDECLNEIRECLEIGWTGLGFKTVAFEKEWCAYTGLEHAHFLSSATAGLHIAVNLLKKEYGWEDGDEVISTPLTFVSTNHAVLYENLKVVFADVDKYLCLDPEDVERKITDRTRAIIFVGIGGNTGQYEAIVDICKRHNLRLILDAAHMSGTRLNGVMPGREADVVVYSFQAVKNLPSADSGMVCFRDGKLDALARKFSWLGIDKDTYARTTDQSAYKWRYDVNMLGFKYHGNSIMASICLTQLKYLDMDNAYRRQLAAWYDELLAGAHVSSIPVAKGCESSRHLYMICADNRDELILALNRVEIFPGVHYRSNTDYAIYAYAAGTCPNADAYSGKILSLPMHLRLTRADIEEVSRNVRELARN